MALCWNVVFILTAQGSLKLLLAEVAIRRCQELVWRKTLKESIRSKDPANDALAIYEDGGRCEGIAAVGRGMSMDDL